jgi:cytoskeleton protein RodZ
MVNYIESDQAEQLRTIGLKLSQVRQEKGISLEEIATKTFIPLRLLTAIEAGRLDLLPEPVFVQGFIRRFATEVGLDGLAIAQEFSINPPPTPEPIAEPDPVEAVVKPQSERPTWLPIAAAGLALALLVGGAISLSRPKPSQLPAQTVEPPVSPKPTEPSATPAVIASPGQATPSLSQIEQMSPTSSPIVNPVASPSPTPAVAGPVELKLNLTEESWVSIEADGNVVYEGTLTKGTQKTWSAQQQIIVSTGNAGGVSASFNGSELKPLGEVGSVTSVSYPPEQAQRSN